MELQLYSIAMEPLSAQTQEESLTCETSQPQPTKIENSVSEKEAGL
jgi:hypothetical protein